MSLIHKSLAFCLVCTWGLLASRASCDAAFSHVYQSTPDYTISHEHFHDHAALTTPFLLSTTQPEPTNAQNIGRLYQNQPEFYSAQERPRDRVPAVDGAKQEQDDLPPGYTSLPAMINIPPGYQLFRGNSEYYR